MTQALDVKINNDRNLRNFLTVTVETTRKNLKCDRVIVYSASSLPKAFVLAESVDAKKYTPILRTTIKDPFLTGEYLERYCYGFPVVIDNIYKTNFTNSNLEDLEKLGVQSLAIAPIFVEHDLLAFLAAHKYSKPHSWDSQAVDLLTERANTISLSFTNLVQTEDLDSFDAIKKTAEKEELEDISPMEGEQEGNENISTTEEQKTAIQEERNKYFSDLIDSITNEQELANILNTSVEGVRSLLKCDRVVVYRFNRDNQGLIAAESVAAGWNKALGKIIDDLCVTTKQIEHYRDGEVRAWDDVYSQNSTSYYLEQLEALEVKALLVAPIIYEEKLFGLLIAHQCSDTRHWQEVEVNWLAEIAIHIGFTIQWSKIFAETEAEEPKLIAGAENEWKQHFSNTIQKLRQFSTREDILQVGVREVRRVVNCDRVVVYSLSPDSYGVILAESVADGWTEALGRVFEDPCFAFKHIEQYRQGRVRAWDNVDDENAPPCFREQLQALEVKAKIVTPIVNEDRLFGLLIAHQCSDTRHWEEQEINWLTEIATQIGLLLKYTNGDAKMLAENNQQETQLLAETEEKWNQHFTDAIQYIRQSLNHEDILKASVKEVRRVLNCDRVVVYSMNQDNRGEIVAESVVAGLKRTKGTVINDPCFETKYLDQYRNGRVRAWSNIYESGLTRCYIEQLEELGVKANLVTPIINEGKLFGLLVAHQCSDFRDWQQPEIRWVSQIATQVGFALDNAKLLADAKQLQHQLENETKLTKYFTDAVRYIRESLHQEDILEISVEEVRRVLNCDRVVVYSMKQEICGTIVAESVAPGWTRSLGRLIDDPCFNARHRESYSQGRVRAWNNIYESGLTQCYIEQLEQLEVKANLAIPIISEGQLFGLLFAHQCSDFREWQQSEIRWVTQIATQVGFALDNAELLGDAQKLRQKVKDENQWTEYLTDAIQHIRQSLQTGDILKNSVREVRRILECDRVVVYSMNQDDRGEIVAESVAAGWTRAKGRVINDPCFEAKYLDMYRNGRVRAWSNIHESGMTRCYVEQLETLEVKANLVTPIINEGQLFGLLVAHQCSDTREWQQAEIRWLAQIATQVGFALDNARLLEQLTQSHNTSNQLSHQQYEQTENLKNQVVEILSENGDAYQTLSQEAMRQSETTINVLHQIQKVADSFSGIALNVQQIKFQEQQNDLAVQDTRESLNRAVDSISNIQRTVQNVALGFDNLSTSAQKLSETVNTIKDLSKQIVQQSMSITRAVNRSQIGVENQNSIIDLSDSIFDLMQQLFEATAKVDPLFANIKTEMREKTIALDSGTQELIVGVGEFQTVRQKLDRVIALNNKMSNLMENIAQSVANQTQSSVFAKDSVREVAEIAERISEQSMSITQSFNQLVLLVQKL